MTRWLLERLEVEGFRGINNEGDPLSLKFRVDAVNSISAPNGVGKSSIFDALSFALKGDIPKLQGLQASERGGDYYVNRFHSKGVGTVTLTLVPEGGGKSVAISVSRTSDGKRMVAGPQGLDAEALLAELNRDFVLLDHKTLQTFIDDTALERGRSFAGLLGLERYSSARQALQQLTNTTAFNNHTDAKVLRTRHDRAVTDLAKHQAIANAAFNELTQEKLSDQETRAGAVLKAHDALAQIEVLKPHCQGKTFEQISIDDCVEAIRLAEGGDDKAALTELIRKEAEWIGLLANEVNEIERDRLRALAEQRDVALAETAGALMQEVFRASREVLVGEDWTDKHVCPTCGHKGEHSLLDHVDAKLAAYIAADAARDAITAEWSAANWQSSILLETACLTDGEPPLFVATDKVIDDHSLTAADVDALWTWRSALVERAKEKSAAVTAAKIGLEKKLPPSLVAVTKTVEAARRLQSSWAEIAAQEAELAEVSTIQARNERVKKFLGEVHLRFAAAETNASNRRLKAVEPLVQTLFAGIMFAPVTPTLQRVPGSEALAIGLGEFWGLQDVSAQALLSESYRNAFAMTVYLAAASLFGGAPLFVVLDDVTSSFDGGHQFHLMEIIRTRFARPAVANGPQVIFLSHDTLLEKLFNKNAGGKDWNHQRLEGTAQTAVLSQSVSGNDVRTAILKSLQAGQVKSAAPRIREYLEFKLQEILQKVSIPVPIDFALDDNNRMAQNCFNAIDAAVKLHTAAKSIVLDHAQQAGLQLHVASISGNYLSHYATGQSQPFTAQSLLGVMQAIDAYADCFMFEDPPGSGTKRYYKNLAKK